MPGGSGVLAGVPPCFEASTGLVLAQGPLLQA